MKIKIPLCACGCGNRIKVKEYHKYYGIPKYLCGHNPTTSFSMLGKHHTEETKRKLSKSQKGRKHTEKSKKKISKTLRGHIVSKITRRKISKALLGRKLSVEQRRNMSKAHKGKYMGKDNPAWQGGTSFEPYPPKFNHQLKESIRKRDNHTCQLCNKTEKQNHKKLDVHHIDYNKENSEPENLISLCYVCNAWVNGDRETWTQIFQKMMKK